MRTTVGRHHDPCIGKCNQDPQFIHSSNKPQCQLYGNIGHIVITCFHWFDVNFQGPYSSSTTKTSFNISSKNNNNIQAIVATPSTNSIDSQFQDTEATHHLTHTSTNLSNNAPYQGNDKFTISNGKQLPISHIGSKFFYTPHKTFQLQHILQVPQLTSSLIRVSKFCIDKNSILQFNPHYFFVKDKITKNIFPQGFLEHDLYRFPNSNCGILYVVSRFSCSILITCSNTDFILWHQRLGHLVVLILVQILFSCNISNSFNKNHACRAYQCAKSHKLLFYSSHPVHNILLHSCTIMYGDQPLPLPQLVQNTFLLFMDDFSRFSWFYPLQLKTKSSPCLSNSKI